MAVRQIQNNPRCKICKSQHRAEIDALLEIRNRAGRDEAGARVTQSYVIARMGEWGIDNPTVDNIKGHLKHIEIISAELDANLEAAVGDALARIQAGETVDADAVLDAVIGIGHAELLEKVKNGQKTGIGVETILKAIQVKTSRKTHEAQSELLRTLGAGIAGALGGGLVRPQIEEAPLDAEDAEFEEVEA